MLLFLGFLVDLKQSKIKTIDFFRSFSKSTHETLTQLILLNNLVHIFFANFTSTADYTSSFGPFRPFNTYGLLLLDLDIDKFPKGNFKVAR